MNPATATETSHDFQVADLEPRRLRPQGDRARRARDAGPDVDAPRVRRRPAAGRRADHRLAAHDDPDRGPDRDPRRARRRGPLGLLQHLLDPGSRRRRDRGRPRGHPRGPQGRPRLRLEGRDARGVLGALRARARLARRQRPEHDPRRRRRRHAARPQGHRVREGRRGAGPELGRLGGVPRHPAPARALAAGRPPALDPDRRGDHGRHRGDDDRRRAALPARPGRGAAVPGDQRQRLGHEVEVRQPLRLPALADRRHQPRRRRDDQRQDRRDLRIRRRRQGLRGVAARPGRPDHHHRDRPDLRAPGGDAGLRGAAPRRRRRPRRHLHHRDRQPRRDHRRRTWRR